MKVLRYFIILMATVVCGNIFAQKNQQELYRLMQQRNEYYFTFNLNVESGPFDKIIFAFSGDQMGVLASCIVGRIPITILDRIITTFAGFGISVLFLKIQNSHASREML